MNALGLTLGIFSLFLFGVLVLIFGTKKRPLQKTDTIDDVVLYIGGSNDRDHHEF